jgi:hypothetical protein
MTLTHPAVNNALRCLGARVVKAGANSWRKRALFTVGVFMGFALAGGLLPGKACAGEPPRQPVRLSTWLDRDACGGRQEVARLSPEIALGLVAFHSPYLFGGKALRSQLTCGACHAQDGPSGAALRLRLRAPVPDLRTAASRVDVAAFVDHAVVAEFDGPPLPRRTARALAALAGVLAPFSADPAVVCRIDAAALVAIGLRLATVQAGAADAEEADFLRDSLRFFLGEMARAVPPEVPAALLDETNHALHDAMPQRAVTDNRVAFMALQDLADRWDAAAVGARQ